MANQITNNAALTVTGETFSSEACPATPSDLHALFSQNLTVLNKGAAIISSETELGASDHDKLWLRLNSSGDPFAMYYRNTVQNRWEPANGVPIGSLQLFAGGTLPQGWLDCDGAEYDSTDAAYEMLFEAIGSTYNTGGETAGHFRVPDFRGRTAVGAGTGTGLTARAAGESGGAETHQLTEDELASHSHVVSGAGSKKVWHDDQTGFDGTRSSHFGDGSSSAGVSLIDSLIEDSGSDDPHNNMQPWLSTLHMIRYM